MGKRTVIWDIISAVFLILAILGYKWLILSGAYSFWAIACLFLLGIILGWDYFISRISALGRLTYDLRRFLIIGLPLILIYLSAFTAKINTLPLPEFFLSLCRFVADGREYYAPLIPMILGYIFITGFYKKDW